ncbi:MAG: hypothetical protein HY787_23625 [Deltaproteobacteria bacterium]|nr:hypothetical protein [Deltaproteobacteria bacterium]
MINYNFILPVWGQSYLETFLNISLPTQLAPQNIPLLASDHDLIYRIYTRPQDVPRLENSSVIARLAKQVKTEIIGTREINFNASNHYDPFSACYRLGMQRAEQEKAAALFLTADQVWANGALSGIIKRGDEGFRSVMISGPRINQETFIPELIKQFAGQEVITISPREAVALAMNHLHPWDRSLFWAADHLGRSASFMYWHVPNEGLLMRCFHLHPILVNPLNGFPRLHRTIDGSDFVRRACPNINHLHVIEDSDEVMYFSIAPASQSAEWIDRPKQNWQQVVFWARSMGLTKHNLFYLQKKIRLHLGEMSTHWTATESLSDRVVDPITKSLDYPLKLFYFRIMTDLRRPIGQFLRKHPFLLKVINLIRSFRRKNREWV